MNTHLWASMEADSGGELPEVHGTGWQETVKAIGYYQMRSEGYSDRASQTYWPFAYLNVRQSYFRYV